MGPRDGDIGYIALIDKKPVGSVTARFFSEDSKGFGFVDSKTPELGTAIKSEHRGTIRLNNPINYSIICHLLIILLDYRF